MKNRFYSGHMHNKAQVHKHFVDTMHRDSHISKRFNSNSTPSTTIQRNEIETSIEKK